MNYRISLNAHEKALRAMPCLICHQDQVTLHHCHGGSMRDHFGAGLRGKSQKVSDWLQIPIAARYHVGDLGIDSALTVRDWEGRFGSQVWFLIQVRNAVGYDIFDLAGLPSPPEDTPRFGV